MKVSSENAGRIIRESDWKVKEEGEFLCTVSKWMAAVIPSSASFAGAR